MSRYSHPTSAQVRATAQKAIDAFAYYGLACCLVGGAACQLYGTSRTPGDVDIVILTTSYDTERLKAMLVARDPTFYLRPAKTFGATYKVLWARIGYSYAQSDACKVDILTPGIMNIPDVPREHIVTIDGFPVMPMIPLLLLKLQAWTDHRAATKLYLLDKQYQDVQDIRELLTIAARRADNIKEASWVPSEFMEAAKPRIGEFIALISRDREPWKAIGYKFTETKSKPKASGAKASVVASGSGVRYQW